MKKLFAILLALCLLLTVTVLAEEGKDADTLTEEETTSVEISDFFTFDITMDAIPEGYTMTTGGYEGVQYAAFTAEDKPLITVAVAHSEEFDGYTMVLSELTDEQVAGMTEYLTEDFFNAQITYTQTTHGTDLVVVNENDVDTDTVQIVTVYDGYIVNCEIFNNAGEVSQADIDTAVQIISDMWFVKAE